MNTNQDSFNCLLVIDDNEAIHRDFGKIFAYSDPNSVLGELDAELFGKTGEESVDVIKFDLHFASQGMEGLETFKKLQNENVRVGAAFVDMRMPPGWDGVETIEKLWEVDPDLQVVICTAFSDKSWNEIINRLKRTDKLLILKKPFDEIEVVQLANSLCEKRRLLDQSKRTVRDLNTVVETQESELKEAHKDAEVLIDSMSSVLVSVDEHGIVSRWNPVAARMFEIPSCEAIGQNFRSLPIAWTDWSIFDTALKNCSIIQQKHLELQFVDSSGTTITLDANICPILNDATSRARLILATDVTRQKSMQSQLDQALRMESVGQLAAGVAHEINTPMQYIGDNVRFVSKSLKKLDPILDCLHMLADPEVSIEQLDEIRKSLSETFKPSKIRSSLKQIPDALNDCIEGVVSVSRIVAAMKEFSHPGCDQKSQVCVNHVLESTITVARNEWKYVACVETEFEVDLIKIDALPSELNQAFLNIVVNAAHAIGDRVKANELTKGLIRITTKSAGDRVLVLIQDNGGGIPACARDRVFEPFFTTKDVGKGTGQGLAIAFNVITQKHDGKISFTVEEGVGTTFQIELPQTSAVDSECQDALSDELVVEVAP